MCRSRALAVDRGVARYGWFSALLGQRGWPRWSHPVAGRTVLHGNWPTRSVATHAATKTMTSRKEPGRSEPMLENKEDSFATVEIDLSDQVAITQVTVHKRFADRKRAEVRALRAARLKIGGSLSQYATSDRSGSTVSSVIFSTDALIKVSVLMSGGASLSISPQVDRDESISHSEILETLEKLEARFETAIANRTEG